MWMIFEWLNSVIYFTDFIKKFLSKEYMSEEEEKEFINSFKTRNNRNLKDQLKLGE